VCVVSGCVLECADIFESSEGDGQEQTFDDGKPRQMHTAYTPR
jgi:hypothetical protein